MPADRYAHVIRAVRETPWAIHPATLTTILDVLAFRAQGGRLSDDEIRARLEATTHGPRMGARTVAAVGAAGQGRGTVAILPIYGVISPRFSLDNSSGGTALDDLTGQFRGALADGSIDGIVFDIDSPGGLVDGVDEFAAEIRASRGKKPIVAVADYMAASAAYFIGSQADELVCSPSGQVGSIGVVMAHQDLSGAYEQAGIRTTLIHHGKYKVEGNEFEPLTDEARAELQGQVDAWGAMFETAVAKGRGVPIDTVRTDYGQGRMLLPKPALAAGMIDRIDTLEATVKRVARGAVKPETLDATRAAETFWIPAITSRAQAAAVYGHAQALVEAGALRPMMAPIKSHTTDTDDDAWSASEEEAKIPDGTSAADLAAHYAWRDDEADPETKAAYKFIHHRDDGKGNAGSASTKACIAGIAVLNGGRGGADIPDSDRPGVHAHLARHLDDAGMDTPPLQIATETALATGPTFTSRLTAVTAETAELAAIAHERATRRTDRRQPLSANVRTELEAIETSGLEMARAARTALEATERRPSAGPVKPSARLQLLIAAQERGYRIHETTTPEETTPNG